MTPKQVALVQDSFTKVALISEAAAVLFYDRLFDIARQMKAMFPDDMIEQRRKLMAMLATVVNRSITPGNPQYPRFYTAWTHKRHAGTFHVTARFPVTQPAGTCRLDGAVS
jgi:hypothetical protein